MSSFDKPDNVSGASRKESCLAGGFRGGAVSVIPIFDLFVTDILKYIFFNDIPTFFT